MAHTIAAFLPITVLMIGALKTKRLAEMMFLSSFLGAVLIHKERFFSGYIDMLYGTLANPSYQFVFLILMLFGATIRLFQESGSMAGLANLLDKYANGPKKPLVLAWIIGSGMFEDDYLNTLAVSFSMRNTTDRNQIPREHLAFQSNAVASCICVLIPFSSRSAFTVGLLGEEGLVYGDYLSAIPFMFYPLFMILSCLLLALGLLPKAGELKTAYARVASGGPVFQKEAIEGATISVSEQESSRETPARNAEIPIVILVVTVILYDNDLVHGLMACLAAQGIMYIGQKIMTSKEFVEHCFEGAKSMLTMAIIVLFAMTHSAAKMELGFFEIVIGGAGRAVPPVLLPATAFVIVAAATFATAGYWVIQVLSIPIFIPLALSLNVNPALVIAAIMSGVTFGCSFCFYADPVFMTAAATGISNLRIIKLSSPYALTSAALAVIGYVIAGIWMV